MGFFLCVCVVFCVVVVVVVFSGTTESLQVAIEALRYILCFKAILEKNVENDPIMIFQCIFKFEGFFLFNFFCKYSLM